ncbi:SRPBCC family protein [Oricola sp.]|uniref:SRPBCC family protein n=1 Tax=Oricola sp. TaxID=1979950 RepID=UPI003BA94502
MKITHSCHVDAPMETVFDAIAHIDKFRRAAPQVVGVEYLSQNRRGVGARFREIRKMGKRQAATEIEVTEYDPPKRVRLVSEAGGAVWDTVFSVRPEFGGTLLSMEMTATARNLVPRIMLPFMKGGISEAIANDLEAVKHWCEANADADKSA